MRWARNVVVVTILLAVLAVIGVLYGTDLPATSGQSGATLKVPLAFNIAVTLVHIGAALLFLLTLRVYKAKLRPAFVLSSLAIVSTAVGTLQIPLLSAFGLMDSAWVTRGGVGLPFLLGGIFAYAGSRRLAKLVELRSALASYRLVTPLVLGLCFLATVLPHAYTTTPAVAFAISSAIDIWTGGFTLVAALLVWQVMRITGSHYRESMFSLGLGFFISAMAMLCVTVETLLGIRLESNPVILIVALGSGVAYLYAGYAFASTEEY